MKQMRNRNYVVQILSQINYNYINYNQLREKDSNDEIKRHILQIKSQNYETKRQNVEI